MRNWGTIDFSKWDESKPAKELSKIIGRSETQIRLIARVKGLKYKSLSMRGKTKYDISKWDSTKSRKQNAKALGMGDLPTSQIYKYARKYGLKSDEPVKINYKEHTYYGENKVCINRFCLKCRKSFKSEGKGNFLCNNCDNSNKNLVEDYTVNRNGRASKSR